MPSNNCILTIHAGSLLRNGDVTRFLNTHEHGEPFDPVEPRDRVMAGSDCGFFTFAGFGVVDPDIVFAKPGALAEGAARASEDCGVASHGGAV